MSCMFCDCPRLSSLPDISKWNTNNVIYMSYMFYNCSSLISLPDISKLNTNNVNDISNIFYNCYHYHHYLIFLNGKNIIMTIFFWLSKLLKYTLLI